MREIYHRKLARDKIPENLAKKGIAYSTRILNEKEYEAALNQKLQEEVNEYICASESEHQLEELADILEVITLFWSATRFRFPLWKKSVRKSCWRKEVLVKKSILRKPQKKRLW